VRRKCYDVASGLLDRRPWRARCDLHARLPVGHSKDGLRPTMPSVTDSEPVPSAASSEALKGQCPISKCFRGSCLCYDRLYTSGVVNTCQNEVTIEVDAGKNYSTGQHKLGKGQGRTYRCQEARDGCGGVKISLIGQETETPKSPANLGETKARTDAAPAKAKQVNKEQAERRDANEDEKKKSKDDTLKVPSFCEGMIHACEERAASLPNLTDATRSQCDAYCRNLRIENCAPSITLQEGAQACNTGAERDQREAAGKKK
jgi:hypothetical protein